MNKFNKEWKLKNIKHCYEIKEDLNKRRDISYS